MTIPPERLCRRMTMFLLVVGLVTVLLAFAACSGGATMPALGTVQGTVTAGPTCPVESVEHPCPPKPVAEREVDLLTAAGATVATNKTDAAGHYRLDALPGSYIVRVKIEQGQIGMRQITPGNVTISPHQTVTLDIQLDTGIR